MSQNQVQVNYADEADQILGCRLREQPIRYPDEALQVSIETLFLQTVNQLFQQFEFVSYLSGTHKENILKNLERLKNECEVVLINNVKI